MLIVATELHGNMTWDGETEKLWATFDHDPDALELDIWLNEHVVKTWPYDKNNRPEGAIWIIAFVE